MSPDYASSAPERVSIDALTGPTIIEFGTRWCGFCQAAQPYIAAALAHHPDIRHLKIEDGKGRSLGRSFQVRLWPTLIFLDNGREVARVVRPTGSQQIRNAMDLIATAARLA